MILKFIFLILFILIIITVLLLCRQKENIFEHFQNYPVYDNIYITNTKNKNVICIETETSGLRIYMTSSVKGSDPSYYSFLKFNLNGTDDIIDIQCANGNYWYFNYRESGYGTIGSATGTNEKSISPIDLTTVPSSSIFENALLFENGTMITFDNSGTHMIFSTIPVATSSQKAQCIFALGKYDTKYLNGNTMILLNIAGKENPPGNYFFYNGESGKNTAEPNSSKEGTFVINPFETTAIFVPNNTRQKIIQFSNGCFLDGSLKTFSSGEQSLRWVGFGGIVNFNLNNSNDLFQIWNPFLSNYFYYNYSNKSGISDTSANIFSSSQKYWNMSYTTITKNKPVNLLPYTPVLEKTTDKNKNLIYSYVDQVLIYNPKSTTKNAILLQVDSCGSSETIGNMNQGTNNYCLTLSSVLYDSVNDTISSNPNAITKISFNFNNGRGDLIQMIINNGTTLNNYTTYWYYNGSENSFNNILSKGAKKSDGPSTSGSQSFSVMPNNLSWNSSSKTLPTKSNLYGFRNTSPTILKFENSIQFSSDLIIAMNQDGNCIWKGSTGQIEFNLVKKNMNNNINIFGITSNGKIDYTLNNWIYNGKNGGSPIGENISSGTLHHITSWDTSCGIPSSAPYQNYTESTGNFTIGEPINQPSDISTPEPSDWSCSNITSLRLTPSDIKDSATNNLIIKIDNSDGYKDNSGKTLENESICVVEPNFTPLKPILSTSNKINGKTVSNEIKKINFSNGMSLEEKDDNLLIKGLYGSFFTSLKNKSGYFVQIQNNMFGSQNPKKNWSLKYTGYNGFSDTTITTNTTGITFS